MSEEGEWTLENLELELKSYGSTMRLPLHHTQLEASFTLPSSRPPRKLTLSETRIPGIRVVGESSTRQTRCSDDLNSLPYVRAARRSFPNFDGDATNEPMSQDSANEEMEDDECDEEDCVELVDIVDSIEKSSWSKTIPAFEEVVLVMDDVYTEMVRLYGRRLELIVFQSNHEVKLSSL
ncbi:unnamed protein product [Lupinus luteus]|uniref:Uncharacterized protein n=1 Tax=Lupinus luteus TaxID=3873 RepID=A0AAV1X389_LUPLU